MIAFWIISGVLFELAVWWVLLIFFKNKWNVLAEAFPSVDVLPDAVTKRNQSIGLDWFNLGWCLHITADEQYLHLVPSRLMRLFFRVNTCLSIPWHAMEHLSSGRTYSKARIGRNRITAPKWCLDLAMRNVPADS